MRKENGRVIPNTIEDILVRLIIHPPDRLPTGCWEWPGSKTSEGYGECSLQRKRHVKVHTAVYVHHRGPAPPGLVPDHLCSCRPCANPDHLEWVTRSENARRAAAASNWNRKKTHCPAGHPYEGYNLIINANGGRACRKCINARTLALWRRKHVPKPARTHCNRGHLLAGDNVRHNRAGRVCVTCSKERCRLWYLANQERQKASSRASKERLKVQKKMTSTT